MIRYFSTFIKSLLGTIEHLNDFQYGIAYAIRPITDVEYFRVLLKLRPKAVPAF